MNTANYVDELLLKIVQLFKNIEKGELKSPNEERIKILINTSNSFDSDAKSELSLLENKPKDDLRKYVGDKLDEFYGFYCEFIEDLKSHLRIISKLEPLKLSYSNVTPSFSPESFKFQGHNNLKYSR